MWQEQTTYQVDVVHVVHQKGNRNSSHLLHTHSPICPFPIPTFDMPLTLAAPSASSPLPLLHPQPPALQPPASWPLYSFLVSHNVSLSTFRPGVSENWDSRDAFQAGFNRADDKTSEGIGRDEAETGGSHQEISEVSLHHMYLHWRVNIPSNSEASTGTRSRWCQASSLPNYRITFYTLLYCHTARDISYAAFVCTAEKMHLTTWQT